MTDHTYPEPPPAPDFLVDGDADAEFEWEDEDDPAFNWRRRLELAEAPPILWQTADAPEAPSDLAAPLDASDFGAWIKDAPGDSLGVRQWRQWWRVRVREERLAAEQRKLADEEAKVEQLTDAIYQVLTARGQTALLADGKTYSAVIGTIARARGEVLAAEPWGTPAPLVTAADLPPFPVAGMPPVLRNMATEVAASVQVPIDLAAPLALAALSGSLCGRVWARPRPGWDELVVLYFLGLLGSGNRKSSLHKALLGPLYAAQTEMRDAVREPRADALLTAEMADALAKRAKADALKSGAPPDAIEAWKRAERYAQACHAAVPPEPVLISQDATPEALASLLMRNGERVVISAAEGGALITILGGRYAAQSYIDLLLSGHVGEPFSQDRQTRDAVILREPAITIAVLSQEETLREMLEVGGTAKRGLIARFLIAAPESMLGHRQIDTAPVSLAASAAYADLLGGFVSTLWSAEKRTDLALSTTAVPLLTEYRQGVEARYRPGEDLESVRDFGGKITGSAVRVAALHHLGSHGVRGLGWEIGPESVQWGIAVAEWSLAHYRYAMSVAGQVTEIAVADRLLKWLESRPEAERRAQYSKRDLATALKITADDADAGLDQLRDAGWVRPVVEVKGARKVGRPTQVWDLHPWLYGAPIVG